MHISKLELENIKSHTRSTFEFERGTTAITGENGAGKTTIIEAIAWALFDLLEYKKEDFVRRGAKKGSVTVTFESGLDEREYVVYRDSGAGYNVTDPRLGARIADKREEVFRFLWQHLGLEPGTDLRSLFRQAIGVPQGTFTAIFLEGATERKIAFDRLLKVEEYRQAAEKLRETSRFLDAMTREVRESIARAEGELSRSEAVEAEYRSTGEQAVRLGEEIEGIAGRLVQMQADVSRMDDEERRLSGLKAALELSRAEKEKLEIIHRQAESSLDRSIQAAERIRTAKPDHERHLAALARLTELEKARSARDELRAALAQTENEIVRTAAEQKRLDRELSVIAKARVDIETLRPLAEEQIGLEKEIAANRDQLTSARSHKERVISIEANLERLRAKYRTNQEEMLAAEASAAAAASLGELEKREARVVGDLATLRASLERDERFQNEIKNGLCPILSQKCLNLGEGETLESFVSSQFTSLRAKIGALEAEHSGVQARIVTARAAHHSAASLENLRRRENELKDEGKSLTDKKEWLEARLKEAAAAEGKLEEAEARLRSLEDPAARIRFLENDAARESDIRNALRSVANTLGGLESKQKEHRDQLVEFEQVDVQWAALTEEREKTAAAHRAFIANEADADLLPQRLAEVDALTARVSEAAANFDAAGREFGAAAGDYDADRHTRERAELAAAERQHAEMRARLEATERRAEQLAAEVARFTDVRRTMHSDLQEKERLEKVAETTAFIRDTLKEAAPRVARNYVYHVSLEANQLFREITGNAEQTLKWADDYSIVLEEDGYTRPFVSLSGGEQMSAALAVRLALLKQLSDIRIAFFDEPTTNLDAERRENFAEQIGRITHFDQLFLISHDDAFDNSVDHVLSLDASG